MTIEKDFFHDNLFQYLLQPISEKLLKEKYCDEYVILYSVKPVEFFLIARETGAYLN